MIQLRPFDRGDIETLYRIDQTCFAPEIAYSRAELCYYLQHPKSITIVAETNSKSIAGFCIGQLYAHEGKANGHIITIDVLPEARRQGTGHSLLLAIEQHFRAQAIGSIRLEVAVDNFAAQKFYEATGYARIGTIRGYYAGRLDALVMQKQVMADA